MAEFNPVENLSPENQRSLKTLGRSLTMNQGQFSLIFARCNYASLRERVRKLLREQSAVAVQELCLPPSAKSLYGAIADAVKDNPPQALMLFGVESVFALDELLTAANRARDRFRRDFPFPMVLWVTDAVLSKLGRLANDLNTWAGPPIHFTVSPEDLREFLCQKVEQGLNCESNLKLEGCEIEAIAKDLPLLGERFDPELQACWEFIQGTIQFQNQQIDAAIAHYEKSLAIWQAQSQLERQGIACMKIAAVYNRKAELNRAENQHYWQQARSHLQEALTCFQQAQRGELVAQCMSQLGEVLQYLEAWQELEALAKEALALHINTGSPNLIAQTYTFLAHNPLSQGKWKQVNELAKLGLAVLAEAGAQEHKNSLQLLLLLGKSQRHLGQKTDALKTLEEAKQIPPQKDFLHIYILILEELQEFYKESHEYLKAFEFKLEQQELETKYRLRAFIGAGRLQPPAPEALNIDLENPEKVADIVEEIVTASGRQEDVNRLIGRVGRPDCKLTVLYGQSGVGKSSIVQAGLIPALKLTSFDGWDAVPVLLQVYSNWVQELGRKLAAGLVEVKAVMTPPQLENCEAIIERLRQNESCRLVTVLIFDQFEEFFFDYKDPESRRQFYLFLSQVLQISYVKVILSLREDYLNYLLEAGRTANLDIIDNDILNKNTLYYLGNFSRSDAKKVIASLTERSQFYLQSELVDALVEELASELGEVRPIELQVVGAQLQAEKIKTLARYQEKGPKKALVERFLQTIIHDCGPDNQDVAKLILYLLTDDKNTRPQKTLDILELELGMKAATLDLVLEVLVKSGLVIRLPSTPSDRYQLVHDYLVAFIRNSQFNPFIAELEREREQRKLTQERLIQVQKQQLKATRRATFTLVGLFAIVSGVAIIATLVGINTYLTSLSNASKNEKDLDRLVSAIRLGKKLKEIPLGVMNETKMLALSEINQAVTSVKEINRLEGHKAGVTKVIFSDDGKMIGTGSEDKTAIIWSLDGKIITELNGHNGHKGTVTSLVFSKDGKTVVTGSEDKTAKIWNLNGGKFVFFKDLTGHNGSVTSVSISPDGKTIASASEDKTVKLWRSDGKLMNTILHPERVAIVSFSPDGKMIAAAGKDEIVKLWKLDGKESGTINNYGTLTMNFRNDSQALILGNKDKNDQVSIKFYHLNGIIFKKRDDCARIIYADKNNFNKICIETIYFNKYFIGYNGNLLAELRNDNRVNLSNLTTNSNFEQSLFSPNGQMIATKNGDDTVKIWRRDGTFLRTIKGDSSVLTFSPDNQAIITGSRDETIKLWTYDGQEVTWKNKIDSIASINLSPDSQLIATVGSDYTIRLWKRDGTLIKILTKYEVGSTPKVIFSHDSQSIATFGHDNKVKLWKTNGILIKTLSGQAESIIRYVVFSNDSRLIATYNYDYDYDDNFVVKLWKRDGGTPIPILTEQSEVFTNFIFSPNSKMIASISSTLDRGNGNSKLRLWGSNGKLKVKLIDDYYIMSVIFSPDSRFIASTHLGGIIKLWSLNGTHLTTLEGNGNTVSDLSFSPNGQMIVSVSEDGNMIIWKCRRPTGKFDKDLCKNLQKHNRVQSFRISHDSQIIASAMYDKTVMLWDKEGKSIKKLQGFSDRVHDINRYYVGVDLTPDGKILTYHIPYKNEESGNSYTTLKIFRKDSKEIKAIEFLRGNFDISSSSEMIAYVSEHDYYLKLWNINNGHLLAKVTGHNHKINSVAFSSDGQFISSASDDKTIKLWDKSGQLLQTLKGHSKPVNSINFNPKDPGQLASASDDKTVRLWNRTTGKEIIEPILYSDPVKSVIFSPDGKTIVSAGRGNINFWSKDGTQINKPLKYESDNNNSSNLSLSSDGSILALANLSRSPSINLYLLNSFWFKAPFNFVPNSPLVDVSFSLDGKAIADVKDGKGYAWNFLDLDQLLEQACDKAGNYLKNNPSVKESDKHLCDDVRVRSK